VPARVPLPERLRPATLDEVVGQEALLGTDGKLTRLLASVEQGGACRLWFCGGRREQARQRWPASSRPMLANKRALCSCRR
jgi:hypothetical protein